MTELHRGNIMELIGKAARRYHSAIMTCYAFDFLFFEERILPQLRSASVKNIQVIADSRYVARQLERTTGKEFRVNKTYTLTTAFQAGVFHPKMLLLTGANNGLLLIGSGNMTSSGMSGNDEVWAAFQYAGPDCVHAGLFAQAWSYLSGLIDTHGRGFGLQGRNWMGQQSAWLTQLAVPADPWVDFEDDCSAALLRPQPDASIYMQLYDLLPEFYPEEITVISPFYDVNGSFLTQLLKDYSPGRLNCIVDPELGTVPYALVKPESVFFYEWQNCLKEAGRLHAKLFCFRYQDEEYLVLGSANATGAAWGTNAKAALNEEAVLVIRAGEEKDFLARLGIVLPKKAVKTLVPPVAGSAAQEREGFAFQLTYAELRGNSLVGYCVAAVDGSLTLKTFDPEGFEVEQQGMNISAGGFIAGLNAVERLFKIALFEGAKRVSNFMVVHRVDLLLKTNPDPRFELLDLLFEKVQNGEALLSSLVDHFSLGWMDDESPAKGNAAGFADRKKTAPEPAPRSYARLSGEEFHNFLLQQETQLLEAAEVRIADFLSLLNVELANQLREDFSESAETGQLVNEAEPDGSGGEVPGRMRRQTGTAQEQRALMHFFNKLHDFYAGQLKGLYRNPSPYAGGEPVGIRALSQFQVALSFYLYYLGRQYEQETAAATGYWRDFIPETSIKGDQSTDWFLADILGKFLLLCNAGFFVYTGELMAGKMAGFLRDLLCRSVFAVLNANWGQSGNVYRDTLLLNICQYLVPADGSLSLGQLRQLVAQAGARYRYRAAGFEANSAFCFEVLLPAWERWRVVYNQPGVKAELLLELSSVYTGQYIFRKATGFARLAHKRLLGPGQYQLTLDASGYPWDGEAGQDRLSGIASGSRVIGFGL